MQACPLSSQQFFFLWFMYLWISYEAVELFRENVCVCVCVCVFMLYILTLQCSHLIYF